MTARARASLGFEDAGQEVSDDALEGFNPAEWPSAPATPARERPSEADTARAARASGFRSREPGEPAAPAQDDPPAPPPRRRTERSMQLNLKARPETIAAHCDIADRMGWGLGETLERAVELLKRECGERS